MSLVSTKFLSLNLLSQRFILPQNLKSSAAPSAIKGVRSVYIQGGVVLDWKILDGGHTTLWDDVQLLTIKPSFLLVSTVRIFNAKAKHVGYWTLRVTHEEFVNY
jgi:hypothetical protein